MVRIHPPQPNMTYPKNFCIAPFLQLTTHPSGSCSPCPYLGGTTWPPSDNTITELWTNPGLEQLRQDFKDGKRNPICGRCWHEEDNGKESLRQRMFNPETETSKFRMFEEDSGIINQRMADDAYLSGPVILTIKNGNICNAKCRTCHPVDSSRWHSDAKKIYEATKYQYYNFAALDNKPDTNWSDAQLDEIVALCGHVRRLELFGGESAYNKQVRALLTRLVDAGLSKNLTLYLNTNGGVDITEEWPFLREFKNIEVMVSIDGINEQFDYIRHGVEYREMLKNVRSMQRYALKHRYDLSVRTICTVNILNVFYLPELKEALSKVVLKPPFLNLLVDPPHLFIKNMPDHVKQAVAEKLGQDPYYADIITIMQQSSDMDQWQSFLQITGVLDQVRKEDFRSTFKEFNSIITKV